jgi:hypothetical protein
VRVASSSGAGAGCRLAAAMTDQTETGGKGRAKSRSTDQSRTVASGRPLRKQWQPISERSSLHPPPEVSISSDAIVLNAQSAPITRNHKTMAFLSLVFRWPDFFLFTRRRRSNFLKISPLPPRVNKVAAYQLTSFCAPQKRRKASISTSSVLFPIH